MVRFFALMAVAILVAASTSVANAASGWGWMRGSALSEFTEVDWETLKTQIGLALDEYADGQQLDWMNPDSGSGGSIKPLSTFEHNSQTCRRIAIRNVTRKGVKGGGVYNLCQQDNGEWMFVTESEIKTAEAATAPGE
ncbi:MAG: RT0821/Lpp0805 family surface protein [Proteobacteria bacterium]|nr:RT0821/Lpp0805 family surface protein [Pseudomonadota bacterium]